MLNKVKIAGLSPYPCENQPLNGDSFHLLGKIAMASLVRRNLFHDKVRLIVTLIDIVFSVVLATIQLSIFVGFTAATAGIIDNSQVDLRIISKNVGHLEAGVPFSERKLYQVIGTGGVAGAEKLIIQFSDWKLPNGTMENILLVGFNPAEKIGGPWNVNN